MFGARAVVSLLLLLCVDNGVDARMVTSVPFFGGVLALVMVVFLNVRLAFEKTGEGLQVDISKQIKAGARAFLLTEYLWLIPFLAGCCAYIVVILEVNDIPNYASKTGGWQTMIKYVCVVSQNPPLLIGCSYHCSCAREKKTKCYTICVRFFPPIVIRR